jgi:2-polyprenyl-6-methoxyphenol hydroxylase-like FAD-dependent oxidoreductase
MKQPTDIAVLIIGAGASGLTLAIDLARRGVAFRLIEKLNTPFAGSRGKGIQPRSQEIFEDLGVINRLFSAGGVYPPQREYRANGTFADSPVIEASDVNPGEPFNQALMVPQFLTEQILRDRLAELGHHVEYGCELSSFEQDTEHVVARVMTAAGEETIRARNLIGADGGRSFVRSSLGIAFPGRTLGVRALVADVTLTGLSSEFWHRFGEGSMEQQIAICPLAGTDLFQVQAPVPFEGEVGLDVTDLDEMIAERARRSDIKIHAVKWASVYTMHARLADRYRVGRIFLVGDAAHIHPPTGGQGLNTSVQDAYNLGWKLAAVLEGAPIGLLDSYEEERRPVAADVLGLSTGLLTEMQQGKMRRGRSVQQLDISYAGGSLAHGGNDLVTAPTAGDRAPDAKLMGAGGQPRRLFDLFAGPHWTLLQYGEARTEFAARPGLQIHGIGEGLALQDAHGHFQRAYGVEPGTNVLVRPDGYIGMIDTGTGADDLEAYLTRVGLTDSPGRNPVRMTR